MALELFVAFVVVAPGGGVLGGAVHSLDLSVRRHDSPRDCCLILLTPGVVERGRTGARCLWLRRSCRNGSGVRGWCSCSWAAWAALDAPRQRACTGGTLAGSIGQDGVDAVGHHLQELLQDLAGCGPCGLLIEPSHGKRGCPVDGDEEVKLALSRTHLGARHGPRTGGGPGLAPCGRSRWSTP